MVRLFLFTLLAAACPAQDHWSYLTYFGGAGSENIQFMTGDGAGGTYLAGETSSVGPPFSDESPGYLSVSAVFLARLDPAGQLIFAKVLGYGSASALAVDAAGNAFFAGNIRVTNGFTTPGVFQPEATSAQAFLAKFAPSGEKLFATYFGSQNGVQTRSMTVDPDGRPIFCGNAVSSAVPLTPSTLFAPEGRNQSAFCAQLTADGASLVFSTLLAKPTPVLSAVSFPNSAVLLPDGLLAVAGATYDPAFSSHFAPRPEEPGRSLYVAPRGGPFLNLPKAPWASVISVQTVGNEAFVGTENAGAWVSPDGGETWRQLPGSPPGPLVAHPLATRFLCVYTVNQAFCSRDGGSTWQSNGIFTGQITLVPDPRYEGGFFVTNTQAFSRPNYVALAAPPPPLPLREVPQWIAASPNGDRILAVVSRGLLLSVDRGATFQKLSDNIFRAAVAPGDPNRLYAIKAARLSTRESRIIRSDDGGVTWSDATPDEPFTFIRDLIVDPVNADTLYLLSGPAAAYRSTDAGASWHLWTPPGLDNIGVLSLHFDNRDRIWIGCVQSAHGFFLKLKMDSPEITWGRMLGGAGISRLRADAAGRLSFLGATFGTDLPVTSPSLMPRTRGSASFIGVMNPAGELESLRYIGAQTNAFDLSPDGAVHLAATAVPADLGEIEDVRGSFAGGASDAVWLTLSPTLDHITKAVWLGGDAADSVTAILAGPGESVRLAGSTTSRNLPVTPSAQQPKISLYEQSLVGSDGFFAIALRSQ